jgi:hypothetical protein
MTQCVVHWFNDSPVICGSEFASGFTKSGYIDQNQWIEVENEGRGGSQTNSTDGQ